MRASLRGILSATGGPGLTVTTRHLGGQGGLRHSLRSSGRIRKKKLLGNKFEFADKLKEKRNYILYVSGQGHETKEIEEIEENPQAPPLEEIIEQRQIIDNYQYRETKDVKNQNPKLISITHHERLSIPFERTKVKKFSSYTSQPLKSYTKTKSVKTTRFGKETDAENFNPYSSFTTKVEKNNNIAPSTLYETYKPIRNNSVTKIHRKISPEEKNAPYSNIYESRNITKIEKYNKFERPETMPNYGNNKQTKIELRQNGKNLIKNPTPKNQIYEGTREPYKGIKPEDRARPLRDLRSNEKPRGGSVPKGERPRNNQDKLPREEKPRTGSRPERPGYGPISRFARPHGPNEGQRPGYNPQQRQDNKPVPRRDERPVYRQIDKPGSRPGDKPVPRRDERPVYRQIDKPGSRPGDKPVPRRDEVPTYKKGDKPGIKPADKPIPRRDEIPAYRQLDKPGSRPGDKPIPRRDEIPAYRQLDKPGSRPGDKPIPRRDEIPVNRQLDKPGIKPGDKPIPTRRDERPTYRQLDKPGDKPIPRRDERPPYKQGDKPGERPIDKQIPRKDERQGNKLEPRQGPRIEEKNGNRPGLRQVDHIGQKPYERTFGDKNISQITNENSRFTQQSTYKKINKTTINVLGERGKDGRNLDSSPGKEIGTYSEYKKYEQKPKLTNETSNSSKYLLNKSTEVKQVGNFNKLSKYLFAEDDEFVVIDCPVHGKQTIKRSKLKKLGFY